MIQRQYYSKMNTMPESYNMGDLKVSYDVIDIMDSKTKKGMVSYVSVFVWALRYTLPNGKIHTTYKDTFAYLCNEKADTFYNGNYDGREDRYKSLEITDAKDTGIINVDAYNQAIYETTGDERYFEDKATTACIIMRPNSPVIKKNLILHGAGKTIEVTAIYYLREFAQDSDDDVFSFMQLREILVDNVPLSELNMSQDGKDYLVDALENEKYLWSEGEIEQYKYLNDFLVEQHVEGRNESDPFYNWVEVADRHKLSEEHNTEASTTIAA